MTEEVFYRYRAMGDGEKMEEGGKIRLLASTDDAINWGSWREVLSHKDGCVDMSAARSLLVNHKADQLCGGISGMQLDGRTMSADAEIDEDARMQSGVSVRKMVSKGRLKGVSIGYTYDPATDATWDEDSRTLTVNRWRLLEISLTPIPADKRAQVRSLPEGVAKPTPVPESKQTAANPAERSAMSDNQNAAGSAATGDEKSRADEIKNLRERAEKAEREASLRSVASEHGVDIAGIDFGSFRTEAEGLKELMKRKAKVEQTKKPETAITQINVDAADKARDMFTGALAFNAGFRNEKAPDQAQNPMRGRKLSEMTREYATMIGENTRYWSDKDVAHYGLGKLDLIHGRSGGANTTTSMLSSFVFLNAITKITAMGFSQAESVAQHTRIVSRNMVPDFKQNTIGSLGVGNFSKVSEDAPLPELSKTEGAYNSTAKTWGGTLSLTIQAFVGDDTGAFYRTLSSAGAILNKTRDRRTFQKLLMGTSTDEATSTWTNNTTASCSPVWTTADTLAAARAKVNAGIAAYMGKTGQDGNPLGNVPRFIIAGQTSGGYIAGLLNQASGQSVGNAYAQNCELVISPWLEASALTGYSTTSFYILADPNAVTGLVLSEVSGYQGINVEPYDAGASLALKWKLWSPFEVDLVSQANSAGTTIIAAAQQCTT